MTGTAFAAILVLGVVAVAALTDGGACRCLNLNLKLKRQQDGSETLSIACAKCGRTWTTEEPIPGRMLSALHRRDHG
jgi:hypothetical protein